MSHINSNAKVNHVPGATNIQRFPGFLGTPRACVTIPGQNNVHHWEGVGFASLTQQHWDKTTVTTSEDGFLYRAIPFVFANGLDWHRVMVTDANPTIYSNYDGISGVQILDFIGDDARFVDELVKIPGTNTPATFTVTNQYGVETEYVLFQSRNTLETKQLRLKTLWLFMLRLTKIWLHQ